MMAGMKWKESVVWIIVVLAVIGVFSIIITVSTHRDYKNRLLQINAISEIREIQNSFPEDDPARIIIEHRLAVYISRIGTSSWVYEAQKDIVAFRAARNAYQKTVK